VGTEECAKVAWSDQEPGKTRKKNEFVCRSTAKLSGAGRLSQSVKLPANMISPSMQEIIDELRVALTAKREWTALTDEQILEQWAFACLQDGTTRQLVLAFARNIETKLKEKNGC
jgi:hypothetical protein